jgi:hypothetical protein
LAYSAAEGRQELLDAVAEATDAIAVALAALGAAYERVDEDTGDRLEAALFRPVQVAYGRAQRTHSGFAARASLPGRSFSPAPSPGPAVPAATLVEDSTESLLHADDILSELQDSMLPVEVGDPEFRSGLASVRETLAPLQHAATAFLRTLGR